MASSATRDRSTGITTQDLTAVKPGHDSGEALVRLVLKALGFGALFGTGLAALVLWATRVWVESGAAAAATGLVLTGPFLLLAIGIFGSALAAGVVTWRLLRPVPSLGRRAAFAVVSAFLTLLLSALAVPAHVYFGRTGLLALALACALGCFGLGRSMRHHA